jgi:hypothetical protein
MGFEELQRVAVDAIKAHALRIGLGSPRAQAYILTEYLWAEEGTEAVALHRTGVAEPPAWLAKLIGAQLADEHRHAGLLRARLAELGVPPREAPALARAKLWWLERACAPYLHAFEAGPIVVLLAVAARLEATGARVFARHVAVLEAERVDDPSHELLRSILGDEQRHARSCAAAAARLVRENERGRFAALGARVAAIDRAFGITLAVRYWLLVAALAAQDRMQRSRS